MAESEIKFASTFEIRAGGKIGGQGSVFVCKIRMRKGPVGLHLQEGDSCAVKAIKSNLTADLGSIKKERREIETLLKLEDHENIVRLFHSWEEFDGISRTIYFAMELCDLCSLDELLIDPIYPLNRREAIIFSLHIAQGLEYIHSRDPPILHCDLKPSNIVLASTPVGGVSAKLIDFGLATELKSASAMSSLKYQQIYSPPEILPAQKNYTTKVDVYGFGIILCQLYVFATAQESKSDQMKKFLEFINSNLVKYEKYFENSLGKASNESVVAIEIKELIAQTTSDLPDDRPLAKTVCDKLREILSSEESLFVSHVPYMKNPSTEVQMGRKECLREFCPMSSARLQILTRLTLSHVKISVHSLLKTLLETQQLKSLRMELEFTDQSHTAEFPSQELREKSLRNLKSFYFKELVRSNSEKGILAYLKYVKSNVGRLNSMLFFGPADQILKNKMRVVVIFDYYKLIDIRLENKPKQSKLELGGLSTFPLWKLLQMEPFERISLRDMHPVLYGNALQMSSKSNLISVGEQDIKWLDTFPSNITCTSLQLDNISLQNLNQGRMFQTFQNLSELYFQGRAHSKPFEFLQINYLPRTIRRLALSEVTIVTEPAVNNSEIWKLDYLLFQICEFPPNFISIFHKHFEVEKLIISQADGVKHESFTNPKLFFPSVEFVSVLTKSPKWKSLRCDYFNWTVAAVESYETASVIKEMRKCLENSAKLHEVPEHHPSIRIKRKPSNPKELIVKKLTRKDVYADPTRYSFGRKNADDHEDDLSEDDSEITLRQEKDEPDRQKPNVALHSGLDMDEKSDKEASEIFFFETSSDKEDLDPFVSLARTTSEIKKIRHIHLRRCKVNGSTLQIALMPCKTKLETIKLEMVQLGQQIDRVSCPNLKTFVFHMDYEGDYNALDAKFENINNLRNILFFRWSESLNGLWDSGVNVKIQKMRCCYLLLDHSNNKVLMECMPRANEVFNEIVSPNENKEITRGDNVEMLTLHNCRFMKESLLSLKLTYLNLRLVQGITFNDLFGSSGCLNSMETLQTLLYEQKRPTEEVYLGDCCELLRNLRVLSLGGVHVKSLTKLYCTRLMLRGNTYYDKFEEEYPEVFKDIEDVVIVGDAFYRPTFMTLYSFLHFNKLGAKSSNMRSMTFVRFLLEYEKNKIKMGGITRSRIDRAFKVNLQEIEKQIDFCKDFYAKFGSKAVNELSANVTLFWDEQYKAWKVKECNDGANKLMLQSELYEYPY